MNWNKSLRAVAVLALSAVGVASSFAQETVELPEVLVSADWVEQNLENPNVRLIEVSVKPGVFERGHIPGAVNFVWHTDFVDTVRRDIVSAERFQELAQAAGINSDTTVVLYGDNNNWFAAWGAWIFNIYGFENVRLLDGGRVKWEADGRALASVPTEYTVGNFAAIEANLALRARLVNVLDVVEGREAGVLVDIRSPKEYAGEIFAPEGIQELSVRAGHIPGAVNVPWGQNVREDGTFKSVEELRALYADLGIDGSQAIITYCRIGERAALTWFVLHKLLGYEVSLYDGSWTEYGNVVGLPIENPAGTVWGGQ
jgi:thiosulfate/3-mercaptopyruvate sulfurtransferase